MSTSTQPSLTLEKALELVPLADGILSVPGLPMLSLPCIVETNDSGSPIIITHFERAREDYLQALREEPDVVVQFTVGFHYIDPSWIPRQPHAPTEVKAVFEFTGRARLVQRPAATTLAMMDEITKAKQSLYAPGADWQVSSLPQEYINRLFPMIAELEIAPREYTLSRLMVLDHLSVGHRQEILDRLQESASPCGRAALRLFEVAYR